MSASRFLIYKGFGRSKLLIKKTPKVCANTWPRKLANFCLSEKWKKSNSEMGLGFGFFSGPSTLHSNRLSISERREKEKERNWWDHQTPHLAVNQGLSSKTYANEFGFSMVSRFVFFSPWFQPAEHDGFWRFLSNRGTKFFTIKSNSNRQKHQTNNVNRYNKPPEKILQR